jgi:hypothetical protein
VALQRSAIVSAAEWAVALDAATEGMWVAKNALDLVAGDAVREAADKLMNDRAQICEEAVAASMRWRDRLRSSSAPMPTRFGQEVQGRLERAARARSILIRRMRDEVDRRNP